MKKFSLLELLHPDGRANTFLVLGSNCPEIFLAQPHIESDQTAALLVLAPSEKECRSPAWLEDAVTVLDRRLADDGVCYVLVPRPWRQKMIRSLSRANLVIDSFFWHFPDWDSTEYLVPLQDGPAQFAVEKIISAPRWKRILARAIFRSSSARNLFGRFWKSTGISFRRPGARPLFQWSFQRERDQFFLGTAIVRKSWRGVRGANLLYCFTEHDVSPSAISKTTIVENSLACLDREAEILEALGPGVRSAGVRVPQILWKEQNDRRSSLFISPLRGLPASDLLASNPNLLSPLLTKIVDWLERWHIATANVHALDVEHFEQDVFAPLEVLSPFLPNGQQGYRDWLTDHVRAAVGESFPFVATHNDLTMANILIDEHEHLGVVDWETGKAENFPLVDFYYAVTDAVRIAHGYNDWLEALKACHQPNGPHAADVQCWKERLRSATEISPDLAELCFHACWLHHASNEHRVSQPGAPRPFLQIVQWLVLNYSK